MKNMKILSFIVAIITGFGLADYQMENYVADESYSIKFSTSKAEGTFTGLDGTVNFTAADLSSAVMDVSVKVATIQTGNSKKDNHARGKKWFNAEEYPQIKFTAESVERSGTGYIAKGKLSIKDVTLDEQIAFTFDNEAEGDYLNGVFQVNRKDYNIKGNFFGFTVGKEVSIYLHIPASFSGG